MTRIDPQSVVLAIELPVPPKATHPNSRSHWAVKMKAVAKQRREAGIAALAAIMDSDLPSPPKWNRVEAHATFHRPRPQDRLSDGSNLNAWLKASEDGLQDAGVVSNDRGVLWLAPTQLIGKQTSGQPRVVLTIRPLT